MQLTWLMNTEQMNMNTTKKIAIAVDSSSFESVCLPVRMCIGALAHMSACPCTCFHACLCICLHKSLHTCIYKCITHV